MQKAIEWKQNKLYIVDQTKLPLRIVKQQIRNPQQACDAIRSRRIMGGTAVGSLSAFALYLGLKTPPMAKNYEKTLQQIDKICAQFIKTDPTAMVISWALERMRRCALNNRDHKLSTMRDFILREAIAILKEEEDAAKEIARKGIELIRDGDTVLTFGNTGSFSSSASGTALGIILKAAAIREDINVLVCESRPWLFGARQIAMELKSAKVPFQLITDNMAAHLMKKGMVDIAMAGAERIAMNGDVIAEIGTYCMAMLAYHHRVSFYVAAPVSTYDRNLLSGDLFPIGEKEPSPVLQIGGKPISLAGVKALYPTHDTTSHKYISALITELGIIRAPFDQNLRNTFSNLG